VSKIVISRSGEWVNRRRRYKLKLDEQELADIKTNEIKEFNVSPGKHVLQATIDWTSSNAFEFDIADGETVYIRLSAFKHANWLIPLGSAVVILYVLVLQRLFRLQDTIWEKIFWGVILLYLGIFLYHLTLGRKRYLWLRADTK